MSRRSPSWRASSRSRRTCGAPDRMAVKRIVPDLHAADPSASRPFYEQVVGLEVVMDQGWIVTFAAPGDRRLQLSVMADDAGAPVAPDVSIEVDDVDAAHAAAVARGDE